ncbi:MAG: FAD-dependent oxidoreductase [Rubrivivax sp.]|nr:FAD-dependent oxidoreductase [Rubrivivax sp.]
MKRVVLAGAGHAHALVLLDWMRRPPRGAEVVLVSPQPRAPYSGMVPGWLAGAYRFDEVSIDVPALCAAAGARWVEGEVHALDAAQRRLVLADGRTIDYDLLSLNVGSTLDPPTAPGATLLALRPLARLQARWDEVLARWQRAEGPGALRLTAVGGGAAGFESLLGALARLRELRPDRAVEARLVTRSASLLPSFPAGAVRAAEAALARAAVALQTSAEWRAEPPRGDDDRLPARELVLWATGAVAHAWQRDPSRCSVAVGEAGFVRIDDRLRSVSHPEVFAAGDCADSAPPLPKAGVYAVRMGPVLAANLRAAVEGAALRRYVPQRRFLTLLATGDGRAIAARGRWAAEGRWAWRWKDRIDRGFMARFALR